MYVIFAALVAALFALQSPAAAAASAEGAEAAETEVRCLSSSRVKSTEVLSNKEILFTTNGGLMYVNVLPYRCPGLKRSDPFMHRTSLDRICDLDVITVLHSSGFGFMPGASCGLGRFKPVDKGEVEELRKAKR